MKKINLSLTNYIREKDIIVDPVINNFHFEMNKKQKTIIGGLASLFIKIYVLYIAIIKGI